MNQPSKTELVEEWKRLKQEQLDRAKAPFLYYDPWGQQVDFHASGAQIRLVIGGNRTGKSTCGVAEDIAYLNGFRHDGSKTNLPKPPVKGVIIVNDRAKIETTIMPKIWEYVPRDWVTHIKNGTDGLPSILTWRNGSKLYLSSYAQDVRAQEGVDWDFAHFDEPPPRKVWIAVRRGLLDRSGRAWLTFTALNCPWVHKDLYLKSDGVRIAVFCLSLRDNPYISRQEKEAFIADLSPDEIAARVDGKFSHLEGAVFKDFRRDIHVLPAHSPPPDAPIFMVMDPHDRRPSYCAWFYVDKRDRIVQFDEWPNTDFAEMKTSNMSIRDYSNMIRDKEGSRIRPYERIIDPNFGKTPSHLTGRTLIEEYLEYGLDFYSEINNDLALGHQRIKERLEYKKSDPGLFVTDNCTNMIWAFESYVWRPKDIEGDFTAREKPSEVGKDQIDVWRYLLDYEPSSSMTMDDGEQPFSEEDYGDGYGG